jgi:N-alpha-acetyltransferase 38, NatC auxiliary subunit
VLATTYEYRAPPDSALQAQAEQTGQSKMQVQFTSRYVGLVVIPGNHIVKMELEEWAR